MVMMLLLIPLGIACLVWAFRGRRGYTGEPKCAVCGYIVVGLPSAVCPECGADLSAPGAVVRAGSRQPRGIWVRLAGWTAFCLLTLYIICVMAWAMMMPLLPLRNLITGSATLGSPHSGAYNAIDVNWSAVRYGRVIGTLGLVDTMSITVRLFNQHTRTITIDDKAHTYQYRDAQGVNHSGGPLTVDVLLQWLQWPGNASDNTPGVRGEMINVMDVLQYARGNLPSASTTSRTFGSLSISSGSRVGRGSWVQYVPTEATAAIWLFGVGYLLCVWFFRRPASVATAS
jgi:hypothetical protein